MTANACHLYYFLFLSKEKKTSLLPQNIGAQLLLTLIIVRNISGAPNKHIRIISVGSCTNDAENSGSNILKFLKCNDISQYYCFIVF